MKAVLAVLYLLCASHALGAAAHQLQRASPGRFDGWDEHLKAMQALNARFTDLTESEAKTGEPIMSAIMAATAIVYGANSILSYYRKMQAGKYLESMDEVLDRLHEERNARCVMFRGVHFQLSLYQYSLTIYMNVARSETVFTEEMEQLEAKMNNLQLKVSELLTAGIHWACRSENSWEESVRESRSGIKADMEARAKETKDSAVQCLVSAFSAYGAASTGFVDSTSHIVGTKEVIKALSSIAVTEVSKALADIAGGMSVGKAFKARLREDIPLAFAMKEYFDTGRFENSGLGPQEVIALAATLEYLAEKSAEFVTGVAKSALLGVVASLGLVKALKQLSGTIVGMMNDEGRYESLLAQATVNHSIFVKESNTATCQFMDNLYSITKGQNDVMNNHRDLHRVKVEEDARIAAVKAEEAKTKSWPSLTAFADAFSRGDTPPAPKKDVAVAAPEDRRKLVSDVLTKDLFGECMRGEASLCYEALNQPIVRRALMPLMQNQGRSEYGKLTQVSNRGPVSDFQISIGTADAAALRSMGYTLVSTEHLFDRQRTLLWMCRACTSRAVLAPSLRWFNGDGKDESVDDEEEQKALDEEKEEMEAECGEAMTVLQVTRGTWLRFCTVDRTHYLENPREGTMYSLLYDVKMARYIYGSNVNRLVEAAWKFSNYFVASAGHRDEDSYRWWKDKTFGISRVFSSAPAYKHLVLGLELEPKLYQNDATMNQYKMNGYPVLAVKVIRGVCAHVSQLMRAGWRQEYVHEMSLASDSFNPEAAERREARDPIDDRVEVWTLRARNGNPDEATFLQAKSKARWMGNSGMVALRKKYEEYCKADEMVPIWEFLTPEEMVTEIPSADWKKIRDIQVCKFEGVVCRSLQRIPGWTLAGIKDLGKDGERVIVEVWFNIRDSNSALAKNPAGNEEVATLAEERFKNWECQALKMLCDKSMCRFENKLDSSNSLMMDWKINARLRLRWASDRYGSSALFSSCAVTNPEFIRISGWNAKLAAHMKQKRYAVTDLSRVMYQTTVLSSRHKMQHLTTLHLLQETTGWATARGNSENFANMFNEFDCRVRLFFPVMWTGWPNKANSVGRCIRRQVTMNEAGVIEESCAVDTTMGSVIRDVYIVEVVYDSIDSSVYQAPTPKDLQFAQNANWVVLPMLHRTSQEQNTRWKSFNSRVGTLGGTIRIWVQVDEALQKTAEHEAACEHFKEACAVRVAADSKVRLASSVAEQARFDFSLDAIVEDIVSEDPRD